MGLSMIPIALQVLPLLPGLIKDVAELVDIVRHPAKTEDEQRDRLDALAKRLGVTMKAVEEALLPTPRVD